MCRPHYLGYLAAVYLKAKKVGDELEALTEALVWAEQTGMRVYEAEMHRFKGELPLLAGDVQDAEASLLYAIKVARQQNARSWQLRAR